MTDSKFVYLANTRLITDNKNPEVAIKLFKNLYLKEAGFHFLISSRNGSSYHIFLYSSNLI